MPLDKYTEHRDNVVLRQRNRELEQQNLNLRQELALQRKIVETLRARLRDARGLPPRVARGKGRKAPETASGDRQ